MDYKNYYKECQLFIAKWFADRKLNINLSECKPITRTWHQKMYALLSK